MLFNVHHHVARGCGTRDFNRPKAIGDDKIWLILIWDHTLGTCNYNSTSTAVAPGTTCFYTQNYATSPS